MEWPALTGYPAVVRSRLRTAITADYPPRTTGLSFALGLFVLALPNFGVGLVVLGVVSYLVDWTNPLALSAAVVVLNPLVKGGVYAASFTLGVALLGPVPGVFGGDLSLSTGPAVALRVLAGNLVLATLVSLCGYTVAVYGSRAVRA